MKEIKDEEEEMFDVQLSNVYYIQNEDALLIFI